MWQIDDAARRTKTNWAAAAAKVKTITLDS